MNKHNACLLSCPLTSTPVGLHIPFLAPSGADEAFVVASLLFVLRLSVREVADLTIDVFVLSEPAELSLPRQAGAGYDAVVVPSWLRAPLTALFSSHPGPHLLPGSAAERLAKCEYVLAVIHAEARIAAHRGHES